MSINIDGKRSGDIELGLFGDVVPKTVENFKELCIGKRVSPNGVKLKYKGSKFHRIVTGFMIQGIGKFVNENNLRNISRW